MAITRFQVFLIHSYEAVIIKVGANSSLFYFYFYENCSQGFLQLIPLLYEIGRNHYSLSRISDVVHHHHKHCHNKNTKITECRTEETSLQKKNTKILIESPRGVGCLILKLFLTPWAVLSSKIQILGRTSKYLIRFFTSEFDKDEKLNSYRRQIKKSWKLSIL